MKASLIIRNSVLRITKENFKINELSDRAQSLMKSRKFTKQSFFNNVLNFIESQNLLPN